MRILAAITLPAALAGWLLATESGLQWLAAAATKMSGGGLALSGVNGTVMSAITARTVSMGSSDLRVTARDVRIEWRAAALLSGRLDIAQLQARDVEVLSLPSPYPQDLRPSLPFTLRKLDIGALRVFSEENGAPAFAASNLAARLESDGQCYRLLALQAGTAYGLLAAGGQMEASQPYALNAQIDLTGVETLAGKTTTQAKISAQVSGNLKRIAISAKGSGAGFAGSGEARLMPYAAFPLADLKLQLTGLDPREFSPEAPHADLSLHADLQGNESRMLEGEVTVKNRIPAPLDRGGIPLMDGRAHATLSEEVLKLDRLKLTLAGGAVIAGEVDWQRAMARGSGTVTISQLNPAALHTRLRASRLNGGLKLSGDNRNQQGVLALNDGPLRLEATVNRTDDRVMLEKLKLAHGQAALTGQGSIALDGKQNYSFSGQLQRFDLAAIISAPHTDLNASMAITGEMLPQASGKMNYEIKDSHFADQPVSGTGRIEFAGMASGKGEVEFRLGDNRLSARGGFGSKADKLQLELAAPALEQLGPGFGGSLKVQATLSGSLSKPEVKLVAEGRKLRMQDKQQLDSLSASAEVHGDAMTVNINAADYRTDRIPSVDSDRGFKAFALAANGSPTHHVISADAKLHDGSQLTLRASGGLEYGLRDWESNGWRGMLTALTGTGALPFKLLAETPVKLARGHAEMGAAEFSVANGQMRIGSASWTPNRWSSQGEFSGIGIRAGIGNKPSFRAREGREFLRLGGEWSIASAAQLEGHLNVRRENGDWMLPGDPRIPLGLKTLEMRIRAAHGRVNGELTAQGERLGDWRASIVLPVSKSGAGWVVPEHLPIAGKVRVAAADTSWLGQTISEDIRIAGRLDLSADIAGTKAAPVLHGQVRGDGLAIALLDQGVRLEQGTLQARLDHGALHIETLEFTAPRDPQPRDSLLLGLNLSPEPGKLSASGTLDINGNNGRLEISANRLPLAQRADRWIVASGNAQASISKRMLTVKGSITADAGLINQPVSARPKLSEDIVIVGRRAATGNDPRIAVDATLNLGKHFYMRASGLEARLEGQLSVRDMLGQQLRVTGSIAANDASFEAYGQRLTVERGIVNFQGPLSDPGLNILALRKGLSVEAGVEVSGTAQHPSIRLVSTPVVPDYEKLSWIVLGRTPAIGGADASLLLTAAGGILGGQSGGLTGQLKQALGVDELSLRQAENTGVQTADANPMSNQIATIGKRLSARAFLSYEQGVTAVSGVTKLTYTLSPRVNIVTQAGLENAIDVFYIFTFD